MKTITLSDNSLKTINREIGQVLKSLANQESKIDAIGESILRGYEAAQTDTDKNSYMQKLASFCTELNKTQAGSAYASRLSKWFEGRIPHRLTVRDGAYRLSQQDFGLIKSKDVLAAEKAARSEKIKASAEKRKASAEQQKAELAAMPALKAELAELKANPDQRLQNDLKAANLAASTALADKAKAIDALNHANSATKKAFSELDAVKAENAELTRKLDELRAAYTRLNAETVDLRAQVRALKSVTVTVTDSTPAKPARKPRAGKAS